ncbi:Arf guanine nucleotide exchange factor sbh1 [Puccinia graminis f. sp. tritici]|uniref:Protein transport protein Sec61 subunit beta n=1 Tax=Puccinia graminis f. sp. tritici TaxID=56615 RepID=A0A5B0LWE1_PUCGR|nr:Arf guanine nucleotide exchange factor sbh1 [Puccinia graminis f. sp. tritici]
MADEKSAEAIAANSLAARAAAGQTIRRRAANLPSKAKQGDRPASTRAAGHGGSSNTMMRLYTQDDHVGLRVEPVVVLGLSVVFVASVVCLHLANKLMRWLMK